ncbi:hypothetical protein MNB_SV-12-873 [hydrothermal vent metagenome]|uniref:Uncharacterized protein n=1 Tax=hydrothermal vent metagenome TaxID=652676 RepID=A0A1W1CJL6_9ZZZZ
MYTLINIVPCLGQPQGIAPTVKNQELYNRKIGFFDTLQNI